MNIVETFHEPMPRKEVGVALVRVPRGVRLELRLWVLTLALKRRVGMS